MGEFVPLIVAVTWLVPGGAAFGYLASREKLGVDQLGALFWLCLIFGPFMGGFALLYGIMNGRRRTDA